LGCTAKFRWEAKEDRDSFGSAKGSEKRNERRVESPEILTNKRVRKSARAVGRRADYEIEVSRSGDGQTQLNASTQGASDVPSHRSG